jgi:hypothetical protein
MAGQGADRFKLLIVLTTNSHLKSLPILKREHGVHARPLDPMGQTMLTAPYAPDTRQIIPRP